MIIAYLGRHQLMGRVLRPVSRSPIRPATSLQKSPKRSVNFGLSAYQCGSKHTSSRDAPDHKEPGPTDRRKMGTGYQIYHHSTPFKLDYGQSLPSFDLAYEVWGKLSERKDNVLLLHTGLPASSHAKSHEEDPSPGWWEKFIGYGSDYPIDLDRYFVVCCNPLGSSFGSTAPKSINPLTGQRYGTDFPVVSIFDMVRAQFKLLDYLGLDQVYASIGSSMGGMQSIAAAWLEPERINRVVSISGCGRIGPAGIAIRYAQRSVLMADPNWNNGFYYDSSPPHLGMKLARQVAAVTYGSRQEWERRFGRRKRPVTDQEAHSVLSPPTLSAEFLMETWLDYSAEQFCLKYDANSWLYVSKAMELFDMTVEGLNQLKKYRAGSPSLSELSVSDQENGVANVSPSFCHHNIVASLSQTFQKFRSTQEFLIVGVQTDVLFPVGQQRDLAEAIRSCASSSPQQKAPSVTYVELDSPFGHDAFLIDLKAVGGAVRGFLS
ncbi:hypothetical protein PGT21_029524 [Puccinia graminis f. sp. tritici]|uniref:AB hydrolase-1 domain-containing protein n=1 Tax=Puccinia graminis f. sp. tritici TaxID=56615 RepID=A0A5B0LRZ2_PUCGR|nr:hypothetical protein PGT21_029524 [Puccinia graminis f. sp. tritici]